MTMSEEIKLRRNQKIKVIFSAEECTKSPAEEECIVLWAADKKWNDFGLKSRFDFAYFPKNGDPFYGMLKLAFFTESSEAKNSHELLISKNIQMRKFIVSSDLVNFFSLLLELDNYRKIVSALGSEVLGTMT